MVRVALSKSHCQLGGLEQGAVLPCSLSECSRPPQQRGRDHAQGRAEAQRGFTLGLQAGQWWRPGLLLCTPQPLFTFSFQRLRSQQQLGQGQREELKDPLCPAWILPRPPTEGGASAEVFVTQSCSDEISGTPAKRMACSLGSCQWRRPRQEDRDQPQEAGVWMQGSAPATRLQAACPMAGSAWCDSIPTRCFLGSPKPESAEDLGQSYNYQLEVSHVGSR